MAFQSKEKVKRQHKLSVCPDGYNLYVLARDKKVKVKNNKLNKHCYFSHLLLFPFTFYLEHLGMSLFSLVFLVQKKENQEKQKQIDKQRQEKFVKNDVAQNFHA